MVKVISAYNFLGQNTFSTSGDIVASCLIEPDRLAIAHRNHIIEILILRRLNNDAALKCDRNDNKHLSKFALPTVDQVEQLLYCSAGNFLLTLEYKAENSDDRTRRFVRVYTNFDIAKTDNTFSTPIRARIASKVTPKSNSDDYIEVIELPLNGIPDLIACCQISGTIAVSCASIIYLYEFVNRSNDTHKFTFIDFFEFPFHIKLEFIPLKLAIAEHVIVCADASVAIAFKIVDLSDINTEDGSTSNSMTTDSSLHAVNHKLTEPIDFEVAKQCNQVNGMELQTDIRSNWDKSTDRRTVFSEERPIIVNEYKILLKNTAGFHMKDNVFYSIRSLVQLKIPYNKSINQIHDQFCCLALKPIYYKSSHVEPVEKYISNHLMKSANHGNCVGFSFFISTVSDGYLYQFTNQGKWYSENAKCLAIYPFTAPVIDVIVDNYVIHAITESGIETFSSRIGHKLFSSYYEYPMISDPYPKETSPLVDVPICVMGICGFFGIKFVCASNKNLVLLTTDNEKILHSNNGRNKNEKYDIDWTIYDLQLAKPDVLVKDIQHLANIYSSTSPDIYYELMEEAHVIIRLARELMIDGNSSRDEMIQKSFAESCQFLADFTIMSDRKEIYSQAVAYYTMCNQPAWEVFKRYKILQQTHIKNSKKKPHFNGLLYTLKIMLSRLGANRSEAEQLTQNIRYKLIHEEISCNGDMLESLVLTLRGKQEITIAQELLELFIRYAPDEIAPICLCSSAVREIFNQKLLHLFASKRTLNRNEKFCLILCLYNNNKISESISVLETMKRRELFHTLKEHWKILFDNFQQENYRKAYFSDVTENVLFVIEKNDIIEAISDVLIYILIESRSIDLDFILKLFMNYFAVHLGQKGYRTSQRILEIILQSYFYDFYNLNSSNMQKNSDLSMPNSDIVLSHSPSSLVYFNCPEGKAPTSVSSQHNNENPNHSKVSEDSSTTSTTVDSNYEDPEFEAMKILFRMYLGLLKQYSGPNNNVKLDDDLLPNVIGYRLAFIDYMLRNSKTIKAIHSKFDNNLYSVDIMDLLPNYEDAEANDIDGEFTNFRRPVVFFERREMFLNKMDPFDGNSFKMDSDNILYFDDWGKEINVVLIKLQALLNSGKLDNSLIDDFIAFVNSNPNIIGIDSLLAILLPKSEGVEFLIHVNPNYLLDYAKSRLTTPTQWQALFRRVLSKKREQQSDAQKCIQFYDKVIDDILRDLVAEKTLEEFLECIPEQEINRNDSLSEKTNDRNQSDQHDRTGMAQDGIDITNPFEVIMREAVAKQRSDELCAMIQSTGRQLYDAVTKYQVT